MTITTIGVFPNRTKNEMVINELKAAGISENEISCLYINREGEMTDHLSGEKVGDGAVAGATTGAVIGAIAGLVVANGILPGIGTLFVAGPLLISGLGLSTAAATTLGGAVTGLVAGGLVGALANLGVASEDAKLYEGYIEKGSSVVVTRTDSKAAMEILKNHGATEVREYME